MMLKKLTQFYHDLHWKHAGWWAKLLLFVLAFVRFGGSLLFGPIRALVTFTSSMYSIAGTMASRIRYEWREQYPPPATGLSFLPFALMLVPSALLAITGALVASVFVRFLSADQCDVVSTVLLKFGFCRMASGVARAGLAQSPRKHTHAFLVLTDISCVSKDNPDRFTVIFMGLASVQSTIADLIASGDREEMEQGGRVLNRMADFFEVSGEQVLVSRVTPTRDFARRLNRGMGLGDQLLKHS